MSKLLEKHAQELRDMWQSRVLAASSNTFQRVLLAAFAEAYPDALKVLLRTTFPGFEDIEAPFLRGHATIMPSGRVVCDMVYGDGTVRRVVTFESEGSFLYEARLLADKLKLDDRDRMEYFAVLKRWIVADRRIGVNGEKVI